MLLASSCSFYQIDSHVISDHIFPSKASPDDITYLENISDVTKPYEIIGQITVNVERRQAFQEIMEKMKREAALLGGDCITNIHINAGTGHWAKIKPKKIFGNANIRSNYIADVIVFEKKP